MNEPFNHTPGPWHVERNHAKDDPPELDTFSVLAPNPDAGKEGVPYSGEYLSVAQCLDVEGDAHLFAAAPDLLTLALRAEYIISQLDGVGWCAIREDFLLAARTVIAKAKGQEVQP